MAWIPALFLFYVSGSPFALVLPVMGFDPFLGKPDYDEKSVNTWAAVLLFLFISLGVVAIFKKSNSLAVSFNVLLAISILIVVVRVFVQIADPRFRL